MQKHFEYQPTSRIDKTSQFLHELCRFEVESKEMTKFVLQCTKTKLSFCLQRDCNILELYEDLQKGNVIHT